MGDGRPTALFSDEYIAKSHASDRTTYWSKRHKRKKRSQQVKVAAYKREQRLEEQRNTDRDLRRSINPDLLVFDATGECAEQPNTFPWIPFECGTIIEIIHYAAAANSIAKD